jgi:hypothetical protein
MMMDQLGEAPGVDQDCVRAGLTEIGPERLAEIVQGGFSDVTDLQATMMACAGGG